MLSDAVAFLTKYDSFLLMAHVAPDGDTLGSCLALQKLLQQLGKQAWVVCDDPLPHLYAFLPGVDGLLAPDAAVDAQAFVAVDCADVGRTGSHVNIVEVVELRSSPVLPGVALMSSAMG